MKLADVYDDRLPIPAKAFADVYHLALAAWHGMDFLVSWNMTHLVNGNAILLVQEINAGMGIRTPVICTPEELMGDDYES